MRMNSQLQERLARGAGKARGFTLVEMMVVLLIIGVVVTFAGFSLRGDPWAERIDEETRRLAALLSLASEEAVMEARELAVRFDTDGYHFLLLRNGNWVELREDPLLRPRDLPEGMELELRLQDGADATSSEENPELPQVYILSSGEMTPFTVHLELPEQDYRYRLTADLLGHLDWEGPLP